MKVATTDKEVSGLLALGTEHLPALSSDLVKGLIKGAAITGTLRIWKSLPNGNAFVLDIEITK